MSRSAQRLAVFLDRDGVLNRAIVRNGKPYPPSTPEELEIPEEAKSACRLLRNAGFVLICVTNQPDVARGTASEADVVALNRVVVRELALDDLRACLHDDDAGCDCRKPRPGLLTAAAADWCLDLAGSFMIGDRWRDIEAGQAAGCRTVFIDYQYDEPRPAHADASARSVLDAARWVVAAARRKEMRP